jgi:hypothetical protein
MVVSVVVQLLGLPRDDQRNSPLSAGVDPMDPPVMLTQGEGGEAHALRRRGWSISAIAWQLDHDRKTVRGYLSGEHQTGKRRSSAADPLAVVENYVRLRFVDDCHVWAPALYDAVVPLGYAQSYPSLVRQTDHTAGW